MPFRAITPEMAAAGQAALWQAYDAIRCPTLLLRGAESDLLTPATAAAMTERGPRARLVEFAGVGHAPTLVAAGPGRGRPGVPAGAMKTVSGAGDTAAPIVQLFEERAGAPDAVRLASRARAFAEPLVGDALLDSGEPVLAHADGVAAILEAIGAAPGLCAAAWLVYAADHLGKPEEVIAKAFGASQATLVANARRIMQVQRAARAARVDAGQHARQTERVRKMLLAFSRDLRVVLLRLASRLQTLRYHAASKQPCPPEVARESLQVFAPLANRLGIWQIKWELEDLAFRFLEPDHYRRVAGWLDEKRGEREQRVESLRRRLEAELAARGIAAEVQGRPKHIYSIWKKMAAKGLDFERVLDVRALRVIVADVPACYAVLGRVHELFGAVAGEFDDYIARPKANGYQSLAHRGPGRGGQGGRDPDPHAGDARACRARRLRALGLQGGRQVADRRSPTAPSRRASPRPAWSCCASCWPGNGSTRTRSRPVRTRPRGRSSTTASTSSRRRQPSWN